MTAPDTPFRAGNLHGAATHLNNLISDAVKRQLEARNDAIESALRVAVRLRCGIRVRDYADGRTTVQVDPTVPEWNIYQEHPDQPNYGAIFEED